jgi:hypothetical protein
MEMGKKMKVVLWSTLMLSTILAACGQQAAETAAPAAAPAAAAPAMAPAPAAPAAEPKAQEGDGAQAKPDEAKKQ